VMILTFIIAYLTSGLCQTSTAWVERSPHGWIAACGDEDGNPLPMVRK
jgi:hypothetical protein